jgi:mono/diheme cytochrome c family protein
MTDTVRPALRRVLLLGLAVHAGLAAAAATSPAQWLAEQQRVAAVTPDAARGQKFFAARHGRDWSCSSCHGEAPTAPGRHAATGKAIAPLAPGANAERFSDTAKIDKWFRRNCNDVLGRECSAGEKADVVAFLMALKP